jgi:hypothetical protein
MKRANKSAAKKRWSILQRQNVKSSCRQQCPYKFNSNIDWGIGGRKIPTLVMNENYEILRKKVRGEKRAVTLRQMFLNTECVSATTALHSTNIGHVPHLEERTPGKANTEQ